MSKAFGFLLGMFLLAACAAQQPAKVARADVRDQSELIVLVAGAPDTLIERAETLGYVTRSVRQLEALGDVLVSLTIPEGLTIPDAIEQIETAVPGVTAGAHHLYRLQASPFAPGGTTYANALIGWPEAGCQAVQRVGMIDAALPAQHPLLGNGLVRQKAFATVGQGVVQDHGAQMAELLVGDARLTDTALFSAGVVESSVSGEATAGVTAILQAVNWLATQDVGVVNISLAGPRNKLLNRGMGRAADDGMVFVAAAGNQGASAPPQYPAAFPFVLAVTALDQDLKVYSKAVRGDHIDVAAPGVDIVLHDDTGPRILSGTSAATPFVTAAVAANKDWLAYSADQVRGELSSMTRDIGASGKDRVFGEGLIQTPNSCQSPQ
ncbi:S8 family serine peptidase [Shimia sp. MMG029]|uniref:S8 family serine peptidase n=1 Tax=Shimia sp. MMG029 TaxID=3021978 RepID=UPI0022FDF0B5|nr:S8 family serine peptidase [Shimia sp. MMG029]MDA5555811.1 S8 family serine peptidase [Shimia sp. MMG029]